MTTTRGRRQRSNDETDRIDILATHIRSLGKSFLDVEPDGEYNHIGATLADAVLQAGISYDAVVRPRVAQLRRSYPGARNTTGFLEVLDRDGAHAVLKWTEGRKPETIRALAKLLISEGVESEAQLREWLGHQEHLDRLLEIRGVGQKTVDYLQILVGIEQAAVDRFVRRFLPIAGIEWRGYDDARDLIRRVAAKLDIKVRVLDQAIWRKMSNEAKRGR